MIPAQLEDDAYRGFKREWKRSPWIVSIVVAMLIFGLVIYLFIYPTLAHSADIAKVQLDVNSVQMEVADIKVELLDREIISTRSLQCKATNKEFFTIRITELLKKYYTLTRIAYPLPTCEDLK
jgi:hypothetical protein